ncbi:alpha-(1,3)-fucosyltransferase C-like [Spodoptera litura]|uniref:Fucosyltransferase n=1 Tax=Spodoptera litura TaxID=69820 RepID=A0A9J7E847_SPOLT|nr:alpha-(1,3)-fucosyltransferase C-like [Spodoptera litura]
MARLTKYLKFLFHVIILVLINYFIKNQKHIKIEKRIERYIPDMKHILMWTKLSNVEVEGQRYFITHNCHLINCYFTSNRSFFMDLRYFDAIVFNVQDVSRQSSDLPEVRSIVQKYIFAANDSSDNYPVCSPVYDYYFNWTWTYKRDSSIPYKFISVYNIHNEELGNNILWDNFETVPVSKQFKSSLSSKSAAAAIYLDKCITSGKREIFLKNLKICLATYNLTLDVFGPCGTMKCGRTSLKSCYYRIRTTYYFYLALEDSIADDYITKTVLFGYNNLAVPVVLGGAEYNRFLPPYSYIDAKLLGEELTAKLMYEAIQNKTKYYEFFNWRNHYTIKESNVLDACSLCQFLNNEGWLKTGTVYTTFRNWWNPFYTERCHRFGLTAKFQF